VEEQEGNYLSNYSKVILVFLPPVLQLMGVLTFVDIGLTGSFIISPGKAILKWTLWTYVRV
jgi:hypothetical protein